MKRIARERIRILLALALSVYPRDPSTAIRYGALAREIAKKARVRIPRPAKILYCRGCKTLTYPGYTSVVRVLSYPKPHIQVRCLICGRVNRYIFDKQSKSKPKVVGDYIGDGEGCRGRQADTCSSRSPKEDPRDKAARVGYVRENRPPQAEASDAN